MKKILFRTGMLPNESYSAKDFLFNNLMGGNIGNLLYTNGIIRNIVTDSNYDIVSNYYKYANLDPKYINENCSAFIIPLGISIVSMRTGV